MICVFLFVAGKKGHVSVTTSPGYVASPFLQSPNMQTDQLGLETQSCGILLWHNQVPITEKCSKPVIFPCDFMITLNSV